MKEFDTPGMRQQFSKDFELEFYSSYEERFAFGCDVVGAGRKCTG